MKYRLVIKRKYYDWTSYISELTPFSTLGEDGWDHDRDINKSLNLTLIEARHGLRYLPKNNFSYHNNHLNISPVLKGIENVE